MPIPTSTIGGAFWPTFYNQRINGSCYNATIDIDPGSAGDEQIYVWAVHFEDAPGYNNAIAYEILDNTGTTILHRGNDYVGADIANMNVGIYKPNGGTVVHVVVAYWNTGTPCNIQLDDFTLDAGPTSAFGLSLLTSTNIYNLSNSTFEAQHIGLDCHESEAFTVVWEDQGIGVFMQGYDYSSGSPVVGPVLAIGSSASRIPDVAMNRNTGSTKRESHIILADLSTSPLQINKYTKDFDDLVLGVPGATQEDAEPFPAFGPFWDDFNMKIDVPDHYTGATSDWAYAYFADDNNKINVRMCNRALSPAINTYTVNNGSLPAGGPMGTPLPDITMAGNAFPTIAYNPGGNLAYVGWYTNYDPTLGGPSNNPLYTYTSQTLGYVSVLLDNNGFLRAGDYNQVDFDAASNKIGIYIDPSNPYTNMYYPKICFSKNNEGPKLFAHFSSHDIKTNLVWLWAQGTGGASYLGKYVEALGMVSPQDRLPGAGGVFLDINYSGAVSPFASVFSTVESTFLSYKQVDWYPSAYPLFRTTAMDSTTGVKGEQIRLSSNPFSSNTPFQLQGGDGSANYTATLRSIEGKLIAEKKGSINELNNTFRQPAIQSVAAGTYQLHISRGKEVQDFKLIKQ